MIDKERILALTDGGLRVFCHYLGFEVNLHRNFRSPFYDDKRASCHIYYDKRSSTYKYYDHGNPSYAGDCFWFLSELRGIDLKTSFPELLQMIGQDLNFVFLMMLNSCTSLFQQKRNRHPLSLFNARQNM